MTETLKLRTNIRTIVEAHPQGVLVKIESRKDEEDVLFELQNLYPRLRWKTGNVSLRPFTWLPSRNGNIKFPYFLRIRKDPFWSLEAEENAEGVFFLLRRDQ